MDESMQRVVLFLNEQYALGRPDSYEIWADRQRPENVITLGDIRHLALDSLDNSAKTG